MTAPASTAGAHVLGEAAVSFLRRHPPFDAMEDEPLRAAASKLAFAYFPAGTAIVSPRDGEPAHLWIVQRGVVHVAPSVVFGTDRAAVIALRPGECFSLGALLEHRPVTAAYVAAADTFCYRLAAADFVRLREESLRFREYGTHYLASLLRESRRLLQMEYAGAVAQEQAMGRSLRSLAKRGPVACTAGEPIASALATMRSEKVGSILVSGEDGSLEGILTRRDVLDRIVLDRRDLGEPIATVMTPSPLTLRAEDTAYDAALLIAVHGIRHVPVMDAGRPIGVVTERDLFALQRSTVGGIHRAIARALSPGDLASAARDIRRLAQDLFAYGLSAEQLTHVVSTLNDALTRRLLDVEAARHELADIRWCWLAFGSEGRYEQTIATDQDSGLVFADVPGRPADAARERLLPFASAVNAALDACGFPLCKGGIMAGNPRWCLSRAEWQAQFESWIATPEPEALLGAAIFFDLRPLHGEASLAESLAAALLAKTPRSALFLRLLAQQAVASKPPLGFMSDFVTQDAEGAPNTIDLKGAGARLFTDAARVMALAAGVAHTGTAQRLREAGAKQRIGAGEIDAAVDAFFFIQGLRLRGQLDAAPAGSQRVPNRIDPERLNEVDRRILKESFRQARKLQTRLALDYGL